MNAEHVRVARLLPWYVNGSLDANELDLVNAHLERCDTCRAAVAGEVAIARRISAPETLSVPPFESIRRRLGERVVQRDRRRWAPRAMAGVALLALIVAAPFVLQTEHIYRGLTSTPTAASGAIVQVVFVPQTTEQELRTLLIDDGLTLVEGPSPEGVYRLAVPAGVDATAYARRLARDRAVRSAAAEAP